jgi:exodeoxyribonuclease-3
VEVVSLNANGLRAAWKKGLGAWLDAENPDLVFIQEVKWNDIEGLRSLAQGWHVVADLATKPGYSGVATLCRRSLNVLDSNWMPDSLRSEGRCTSVEVDGVRWVNLYLPSGSQGAQRQALKLEALEALGGWLRSLQGPTVLGGDWNLAPSEFDVHDPKRLDGTPGFTPEERSWMAANELEGWVEGFRHLNRNAREVYSWWSARSGAYDRNKGWRIDHFVTNCPERVQSVDYLRDCRFSDHAPVRLRWS